MSVEPGTNIPKPCNQEIFDHGKPVGILVEHGGMWDIQRKMDKIGGLTDWHYAAGHPVVLTLSEPRIIREIMEKHGFVFYD